MTPRAASLIAALVAGAVILQTALLAPLGPYVPHLVMVAVVAVALAVGPQAGVIAGLMGGLLIDLAPPGDHLVGRWAVALIVVGYLCARVRYKPGRRVGTAALVAAASFVGYSVFALTGLVGGERSAPLSAMVAAIAISVVLNAVIGGVFVPSLTRLIGRWHPAEALVR